jgi:hypothetical protein
MDSVISTIQRCQRAEFERWADDVHAELAEYDMGLGDMEGSFDLWDCYEMQWDASDFIAAPEETPGH